MLGGSGYWVWGEGGWLCEQTVADNGVCVLAVC